MIHRLRPPEEIWKSEILAINSESQVLVCRQENSLEWCFPNGLVEIEEAPIDAAQRELMSWSGYRTLSIDFLFTYTNNDSLDYIFRCRHVSGNPNPIQGIESKWEYIGYLQNMTLVKRSKDILNEYYKRYL
jgi:hypothetical protein